MILPPEIKEIIIDNLECEVDVSNAWFAFFNTLEGLSDYHERRYKKEIKAKASKNGGVKHSLMLTKILDDITGEHLENLDFSFDEMPFNEAALMTSNYASMVGYELQKIGSKLAVAAGFDKKLTVLERIEAKEIIEAFYSRLQRMNDDI